MCGLPSDPRNDRIQQLFIDAERSLFLTMSIAQRVFESTDPAAILETE
jgi:hypothetical protein